MFSKLDANQKALLIQCYKDNVSTKVIADRFGVTRTDVIYLVRQSGTTMRPPHKWNKYYFDEHFFDALDSQEKAYLLGFLYADGYLYSPHRKVGIDIALRDEELLIQVKKLIKSTYPFHYNSRLTKSGYISKSVAMFVNSQYFFNQCLRLGLAPRKSFTLRFPSQDQVPPHLLRHFVRGYFDGDGSITCDIENKRIDISIIGTHEFVCALKSAYGSGTIILCKQSPKMSYFRLGGTYKVKEFLDWLYEGSAIHMARKREKYDLLLSSLKILALRSDRTSRYFGVQKYYEEFIATAYVDGKSVRIGLFSDEKDAAVAYDQWCVDNGRTHLHHTNFI